jgi:AraC-like DNA-binding protein
MKANFRKLEDPIGQAFHIRKDNLTHFNDKWHFHDMLELVVILKGHGKRFVGDSIETFSKGDVILVGEKLSHVWRSDPPKNTNSSKMKCSAIIIQFPSWFLGDKFLELPESVKLKELYKNAERGICFQEETRKKMKDKIEKLLEFEGMERLLSFLDVLHLASKSKEYSLIATPLFKETIFNADLKINQVFEFIMDNFSNSITLDEVAQVASMNKSAFCRYFKNKTKKTFSTFLNEIRIGYACKLIRENNCPIMEAAYLSGYNSPSHFNKQFRLIKNISPSKFCQDSKDII